MDFDFKVPSTIPQDLFLIQSLIGDIHPRAVTVERASDSPDSSSDSNASTKDEVESEDEVEADLALQEEDRGLSAATSYSDPELHSNPSSDSEEDKNEVFQEKNPADDVEDEESSMTAATGYLQTKNEIVDAHIMVPTISEVDPHDTLEKVGEIMSVFGNIVIVKGLPVDRVHSLFGRALDAESLLVFEDRKVLGYIYETFGPTSQPLYQVKFNHDYPLDADKIRLSREVFHVPKRSHFVFVEQLKKLRGSDASNIHDEEPAEDEVEFSDDEKEAAFKADRKKRGRSISSSRQSTPARSRVDIDDMIQTTYAGSNPYEACGPYDDDFHVTGPSRPAPAPYDDPYADIPTSDIRAHPMGMHDEFKREPNSESAGDGPQTFSGRVSCQGIRGRGYRNRQSRNTARRGYRHASVSQRTFDLGADRSSFLQSTRINECAIDHAITPNSLVQSAPDAWLSPETHDFQPYQQPFIQPHINPLFASIFGMNLPSGSMAPWMSQNPHNHVQQPQHWDDTWTVHDGAGSENQGDTYRPM